MLWEDSIGPWDHEIHSMGHINKNLIAIGDQRKQERMKNKLIKVKGEVERIHKCGVACWRLGCQGRRREINVGRVSEDEELMMITKKVKLKTSYDT